MFYKRETHDNIIIFVCRQLKIIGADTTHILAKYNIMYIYLARKYFEYLQFQIFIRKKKIIHF